MKPLVTHLSCNEILHMLPNPDILSVYLSMRENACSRCHQPSRRVREPRIVVRDVLNVPLHLVKIPLDGLQVRRVGREPQKVHAIGLEEGVPHVVVNGGIVEQQHAVTKTGTSILLHPRSPSWSHETCQIELLLGDFSPFRSSNRRSTLSAPGVSNVQHSLSQVLQLIRVRARTDVGVTCPQAVLLNILVQDVDNRERLVP